MASPLDIRNKKTKNYNEYIIPKKIDLAINLIQSFISNNNPLGLKFAILLSASRKQISYDINGKVTFDIELLCKSLNIDRKYLNSNLSKMKETKYTYVLKDGTIGETIPFHTHEYSPNNKTLSIYVSSRAKELFTELAESKNDGNYQFTQAISNNLLKIDLRNVHKHTLKMQMLLEMIRNFTYAKRKEIPLEELNGYFGTKYKRWIDLDRKILQKVKKDIDSNSSFSFIYEGKTELQGTGRPKVTKVIIDVIDNENLFTLNSGV